MSDKILVAFASRYNSTREIAECISEQLRQHYEVDLCEAGEVQSLTPYRAVVLGSAVYEDGWLDSAAHFLTAREDELQTKDLWLFSSGPVQEGNPVDLMGDWKIPETLKPVVERLSPQGITVFSGRVCPDRLTLDDWCMQRDVRDQQADFRDWGAIQAWAKTIAETLSPLSKHNS